MKGNVVGPAFDGGALIAVSFADVVLVRGVQAKWYLDGQLSRSVPESTDHGVGRALLLEPDGSLVAPVEAAATGEDQFALWCPKGTGDSVVGRLNRFKMRTKVEFDLSLGWVERAIGPEEAPATGTTSTVRSGLPGRHESDVITIGDFWLRESYALGDSNEDYAALFPATDSRAQLLRILAGIPEWGREMDFGMNPMELGEAYIHQRVDFEKGCYTGQELVERVDSRGYKTPRRLSGFAVRGRRDIVDSFSPGYYDHNGRRAFSVTSFAVFEDAECGVGLGFSQRVGGGFLDRIEFEGWEIVATEPAELLRFLRQQA